MPSHPICMAAHPRFVATHLGYYRNGGFKNQNQIPDLPKHNPVLLMFWFRSIRNRNFKSLKLDLPGFRPEYTLSTGTGTVSTEQFLKDLPWVWYSLSVVHQASKIQMKQEIPPIQIGSQLTGSCMWRHGSKTHMGVNQICTSSCDLIYEGSNYNRSGW